MNYSEDTIARLLLVGDIIGGPALSLKEFREFEELFYNKDLSNAMSLTLWEIADLVDDKAKAEKIYSALKQDFTACFEKLNEYNIKILTEKDSDYPVRLKEKQGIETPVIIYAVGNTALLNMRSASVTGARKISEKGLKISYDVGETIAREGKILVSGGARGCDKKATENAIKNGGKAVWFMAVPINESLNDSVVANWINDRKICLCWDYNPFGAFQSKNALRRNKYIYANSETAFVCQCDSKISGTYSGASFCLKNKLCELFVYDNNSEAVKALVKNGAIAIVES